MNNLQTNALRIVELTRTFMYDGLIKPQSMSCAKAEEISSIAKFSSYDGLMPIVRECNNSYLDEVTHEIEISKYCVHIHIEYLNESEEFMPVVDSYSYSYDTEPEYIDFIEALQMACIKYLELKIKYKN